MEICRYVILFLFEPRSVALEQKLALDPEQSVFVHAWRSCNIIIRDGLSFT
jgi:hypothetical protein